MRLKYQIQIYSLKKKPSFGYHGNREIYKFLIPNFIVPKRGLSQIMG